MKRRNMGFAVMGTAVAALALSACSTANPGDAAVVGDTRIPQTTIAEQMKSLNEAVGQPADTPDANLARTLVSYNIGYELIGETAAQLGVTVPAAQLDEIYKQQIQQLGGQTQLEQAAARQGVAPANLRRDLETQLLASAIVTKVAPEGDEAAGQAVLVEQVRAVADSIGVEVAPKYGTWDSEQLQLLPDADPVSRPEQDPAAALPMP